jgi:hypothetical protein
MNTLQKLMLAFYLFYMVGLFMFTEIFTGSAVSIIALGISIILLFRFFSQKDTAG